MNEKGRIMACVGSRGRLTFNLEDVERLAYELHT